MSLLYSIIYFIRLWNYHTKPLINWRLEKMVVVPSQYYSVKLLFKPSVTFFAQLAYQKSLWGGKSLWADMAKQSVPY